MKGDTVQKLQDLILRGATNPCLLRDASLIVLNAYISYLKVREQGGSIIFLQKGVRQFKKHPLRKFGPTIERDKLH